MYRRFFSILFSAALLVVALSVVALSLAAPAQAEPTLTTVATPSATLGDPIKDTATLSGATTGTITFNAYGPDDEDCTSDPAFTSEVDVTGDSDYSSEEFV